MICHRNDNWGSGSQIAFREKQEVTKEKLKFCYSSNLNSRKEILVGRNWSKNCKAL